MRSSVTTSVMFCDCLCYPLARRHLALLPLFKASWATNYRCRPPPGPVNYIYLSINAILHNCVVSGRNKALSHRSAKRQAWVSKAKARSVRNLRYQYLAHIWRLVRWATSCLGHIFTHVFASTERDAVSGLCSSHKCCPKLVRVCKGLLNYAKQTLQLIQHIAQHRCMRGMSYLLCIYLVIVQSGLDEFWNLGSIFIQKLWVSVASERLFEHSKMDDFW